MLLALLAAAAAQTLEPGMVRTPDEPARCNPALAQTALTDPAQLRRLGELPPGLLQLAVNKKVAGCSVTVLPQRDENGQHLMLRGPSPRVTTAHERRSAPHGRSQRQR